MSYPGLNLSAPVSADVTFRKAAVLDPDTGEAANASTQGAACVGIFAADTTAASGELASIQTTGVAPCIYGAAADYWASLMTDNQGRLITATGSSGDAVECVGRAWQPGAAANDFGEVFLERHVVVIP